MRKSVRLGWFAVIGVGLGTLLTLSIVVSQTAHGEQRLGGRCQTDADCLSYNRCERNICISRSEITDTDGDGHNAIRYDGDDCDDRDANTFPGRMEVWDEPDHDEDCDPGSHGLPPAFFPKGLTPGNGQRLEYSVQICSENEVIIYAPEGTRDLFTHASCGSGQVCVSQPSGAGVCMAPPPGHVPARRVIAPRGPQRRIGPGETVTPQASTAPGVAAGKPEAAFDLGRVWTVSESGWKGTWTRRGMERVFDAVWIGPGGEQVKDEIRVESLVGDTIVLRRVGLNGTYTGKIRDGGRRLEGTASWFPPNATWSADVK